MKIDSNATQSLFLECGYNTKFAVYTTKEEDYEYKGRAYPSIKKLYLAHEDPTEYDFAIKYFHSWKQWKRITENRECAKFINEWREELELKLRSQAVRDIMNQCVGESGSFQAAKWLADRGWDKRGAGRPSKKEAEKEKRMQERIQNEFYEDIARLQ